MLCLTTLNGYSQKATDGYTPVRNSKLRIAAEWIEYGKGAQKELKTLYAQRDSMYALVNTLTSIVANGEQQEKILEKQLELSYKEVSNLEAQIKTYEAEVTQLRKKVIRRTIAAVVFGLIAGASLILQ